MPIQILEYSGMFVLICDNRDCGRDLTTDNLNTAIDDGWIFNSENMEKGTVTCPECMERELEEGIYTEEEPTNLGENRCA